MFGWEFFSASQFFPRFRKNIKANGTCRVVFLLTMQVATRIWSCILISSPAGNGNQPSAVMTVTAPSLPCVWILCSLDQLLGNRLWWPWLLALSGASVLLALLAWPLLPESPRFLFVVKGKTAAAIRGLFKPSPCQLAGWFPNWGSRPHRFSLSHFSCALFALLVPNWGSQPSKMTKFQVSIKRIGLDHRPVSWLGGFLIGGHEPNGFSFQISVVFFW